MAGALKLGNEAAMLRDGCASDFVAEPTFEADVVVLFFFKAATAPVADTDEAL